MLSPNQKAAKEMELLFETPLIYPHCHARWEVAPARRGC